LPGVWWATRPKPVAVVLREIERGLVESTIANTRAGTVEACQRTRCRRSPAAASKCWRSRRATACEKGQLLMKLWNDDQQAQSAWRWRRWRPRASASTKPAPWPPTPNAKPRGRRPAGQGFVSGARRTARAARRRPGAPAARRRRPTSRSRSESQPEPRRAGADGALRAFAGTIAKIVGEVGEYSTPSPPGVPTPPAIDLIDDSCLYVKAPMDEVDAPKISAGQPVRISLDALPGQSFPGKVRRVAPYVSAVEKQARTVDIEATFDDPAAPGKLLVGYSADVEVILACARTSCACRPRRCSKAAACWSPVPTAGSKSAR
jgi:HlyD family secretion protein